LFGYGRQYNIPVENDLYRRCLEQLKSWTSAASRGVMVLRGARQVGKTTLIRLLAKELGLTLIEVNLEDPPSFAGMLDKRSNAKEILELLLLEKGARAFRACGVCLFRPHDV
jgi:predicted AAA+ superfamily ATPase